MPAAALGGVVLPIGGYKGSGLAMLMDILGGVLSGAAYGGDVGDQYKVFDRPQDVGHFFLAMKPDLFVLAERLSRPHGYADRARARDVRPRKASDGRSCCRASPSGAAEQARRRTGIPYSAAEIAALQQEAAKAGVAPLAVSRHGVQSGNVDIVAHPAGPYRGRPAMLLHVRRRQTRSSPRENERRCRRTSMSKLHATLLMAAGLLLALTTAVAAQDYPTKPVRLIIPFPPGGSNDVVGRMIATQLSERLGKQVVVDNRAGAGGVIGTELAANAPPDGYTLLIVSIAHAVNPVALQAALRSDQGLRADLACSPAARTWSLSIPACR